MLSKRDVSKRTISETGSCEPMIEAEEQSVNKIPDKMTDAELADLLKEIQRVQREREADQQRKTACSCIKDINVRDILQIGPEKDCASIMSWLILDAMLPVSISSRIIPQWKLPSLYQVVIRMATSMIIYETLFCIWIFHPSLLTFTMWWFPSNFFAFLAFIHCDAGVLMKIFKVNGFEAFYVYIQGVLFITTVSFCLPISTTHSILFSITSALSLIPLCTFGGDIMFIHSSIAHEKLWFAGSLLYIVIIQISLTLCIILKYFPDRYDIDDTSIRFLGKVWSLPDWALSSGFSWIFFLSKYALVTYTHPKCFILLRNRIELLHPMQILRNETGRSETNLFGFKRKTAREETLIADSGKVITTTNSLSES